MKVQKILRNHFIQSNNNSATDLFIKNLKKFSFALILAKMTLWHKSFSCFWISNSVIHFEYWFSGTFSHLIAYQNKSRPGGELLRTWTHGNISFPQLSGKKLENYFDMKSPWDWNVANKTISFLMQMVNAIIT